MEGVCKRFLCTTDIYYSEKDGEKKERSLFKIFESLYRYLFYFSIGIASLFFNYNFNCETNVLIESSINYYDF